MRIVFLVTGIAVLVLILLSLCTPWNYGYIKANGVTINTFIDGTARAQGNSAKVGSDVLPIYQATMALMIIAMIVAIVFFVGGLFYVGFVDYKHMARLFKGKIHKVVVGTGVAVLLIVLAAVILFAAGITDRTNTDFSGDNASFRWGPSAGWFFALFTVPVVAISTGLVGLKKV